MKYPDDFINKVICGDCLEVMRHIPDGAVFLWTDPIYNVGKDYGVCKDNLPDEKYLEYMDLFFREAKRISASMAIYLPKKWKLQFWNMLGDGFNEIILTLKPSGAIRYGYSNQFHTILTNAKPKKIIKNVWDNCQMPGMGYFFKENTYGHPGYTSVDISRRVIKYLSKDGDVIYDPFGGTGSSAVASKNLNRDFIITEINQKYCDIANERLRQEELF